MTPGGSSMNVTLGSGFCKITGITDEYIECVPPDDEPSPATLDDLHIVCVGVGSWFNIGGSRGRARRTLTLRDPILSFSHTFSPKSTSSNGSTPRTGNPGSATVQ